MPHRSRGSHTPDLRPHLLGPDRDFSQTLWGAGKGPRGPSWYGESHIWVTASRGVSKTHRCRLNAPPSSLQQSTCVSTKRRVPGGRRPSWAGGAWLMAQPGLLHHGDFFTTRTRTQRGAQACLAKSGVLL